MGENNNAAIIVKDLYKSFRLPHEQHSGLKQAIVGLAHRNRKKGYEIQHVLSDVSFEVKKGDFFGIVGRNGSGKSTLLKLLAEIYTPDKGVVRINGSLTPFIELGVGFNPELTGRENVFMNGALLGFDRKQVEAMYDEIVEFAELSDFMDQKLKNYSSGMQVRLAFSIAIQADSDILLLDEVLAVGDEAFQKKCYGYFDQLKRNKKTVVLVTHDMAAVERFCNKAVFIEDGSIKLVGKPHKVAAAYSRSNDERYEKSLSNNATDESNLFSIKILNDKRKEVKSFDHLDTMTVSVDWKQTGVSNVGVAIFRDNGEYVFGPNTYLDDYTIAKEGKAEYAVKLNLNHGEYFLKAALLGKDDHDVIAFIEEGPHFIVKRNYDNVQWGGVTHLQHEWR